MRKYTLNSGFEIPAVGFGTWEMEKREELLNALECVYQAGCRHIDTAAIYGNEGVIGEFLRTKDRSTIFLTTKLWNADHDRVREACAECMKRLGVDYIDLYLVHWPVKKGGMFDVKKVWTQMEDLVYEKKVRSIGVANFGLINLNKVLSFCRIKPAVDQVELHPYLPQDEIREFCTGNSIRVISYSSLGSTVKKDSVKDDPTIAGIAKKYSVTPTKILLSFCVKVGCCVIPRSCSKEHIADNMQIIDLTDEDVKTIRGIKKRVRFIEIEEFGQHRFD